MRLRIAIPLACLAVLAAGAVVAVPRIAGTASAKTSTHVSTLVAHPGRVAHAPTARASGGTTCFVSGDPGPSACAGPACTEFIAARSTTAVYTIPTPGRASPTKCVRFPDRSSGVVAVRRGPLQWPHRGVVRPAGGDRPAKRVSVPGQLSVRVPAGWHVRHGWLSDVVDPAPRLAVASFPARLSRHTCECGFPNVVNFPPNGAFVFVWEYLHPSRRSLARAPRRPARIRLTADGKVRQTCNGPSDGLGFKDAGRVFQVEIYIGPKAGATLRARLTAVLDSLRVEASS